MLGGIGSSPFCIVSVAGILCWSLIPPNITRHPVMGVFLYTERKNYMTVNILGTKYKIKTRKVSQDSTLKDRELSGYCAEDTKEIILADTTDKDFFPDMNKKERKVYRKTCLRHEIVHAFLCESGLTDSTSTPEHGWARHEEMVDWIAIQSPKLFEAFKKCDCL